MATRNGSVSVVAYSSTQFGLVLVIGQHWGSLTIAAHGRTWRYLQRFFTRIPWKSWQRGPFESRNAFVRLDSHGRIYLTAPDGTAVGQPSGYPFAAGKELTRCAARRDFARHDKREVASAVAGVGDPGIIGVGEAGGDQRSRLQSRNRNRRSKSPPLCLWQQARQAITRRTRRTRGNSLRQFGQR